MLFNNWALVLAILLTTGDKRPYRLAAGPLQRAAGRHWRLGKLSRRRVGNGGDGPEYGADVRLVALMQYLRVLFVVGAAALVVRYARQ